MSSINEKEKETKDLFILLLSCSLSFSLGSFWSEMGVRSGTFVAVACIAKRCSSFQNDFDRSRDHIQYFLKERLLVCVFSAQACTWRMCTGHFIAVITVF